MIRHFIASLFKDLTFELFPGLVEKPRQLNRARQLDPQSGPKCLSMLLTSLALLECRQNPAGQNTTLPSPTNHFSPHPARLIEGTHV